MKNITLSADHNLIEKARAVARSQRRTLNAVFREWLEQFTAREGNVQEFDALMRRLDSPIVAAALEARCSILYSEDFQHGQKFSDLRVVNPFL